jgi:nucleotide-binding universal stress UspA family protein
MDSTIVSVYTLLEREGEEAMEFVKGEAEKMGVKVIPRIEEGSPSRRIVDLSAEHDLVVMGTLGRTGFSKLLLGSVAERVVRFSKCPVLVVRSTEEEN